MSSLQIPGKRLAVQPQVAVLTGIWVCNRGAESADFTLYSEPASSAADINALVHEYAIGAGEFLLLPGSNAGPIYLLPGEAISGEASGADLLVVTVYGYTTDPRIGE
jgi:hypothetical protein